MKKWVADRLICPECIAKQIPLELISHKETFDDIIEGKLECRRCHRQYPISGGIATLLPDKTRTVVNSKNGYNSPAMLSAYLWSHFSDLLNEKLATDAYRVWSNSFQPTQGDALDVGCAVGRLAFELSQTHERVIGVDTSLPFIAKAREILRQERLNFELILEGHLTEVRNLPFNNGWNFDRIDFIVADAQALPFADQNFATIAAINILEKVPDPLQHLAEVNRVLRQNASMFLFSDPFSWDASVSSPEQWLGGNGTGRYSARGIDTMRRFFTGEYGVFDPPLNITAQGDVSWKIRKTENLWEYITSQYLVGRRQ